MIKKLIDNKEVVFLEYAAIFPFSVHEQTVFRVWTFIMDNYGKDPLKMAFAYDFNSLDILEDFIKSCVIARTDKSALYKYENIYCCVTDSALVGLSGFYVCARKISKHVLDEHGEAIIAGGAYDKISSYLFGAADNGGKRCAHAGR